MALARNKRKNLKHCRARSLVAPLILAACVCLPSAGCGLLPASASRLPSKLGLRSEKAELRERLKADKFPTAKEAGL
jgi:hypothetical protein